jgi:hypothetical protein
MFVLSTETGQVVAAASNEDSLRTWARKAVENGAPGAEALRDGIRISSVEWVGNPALVRKAPFDGTYHIFYDDCDVEYRKTGKTFGIKDEVVRIDGVAGDDESPLLAWACSNCGRVSQEDEPDDPGACPDCWFGQYSDIPPYRELLEELK